MREKEKGESRNEKKKQKGIEKERKDKSRSFPQSTNHN
jgi:hypothetical protein